jgi:MFS family permease
MKTADWLVVLVVGFTGAFLGVVFIIVAPVLPLIAKHYGGGHEGAFVAEWVLTIPSIGIVIGGPTTGWFVERFGARTVLLVCFTVFGLAGLGGLYIEDRWALLFSRFIVGIAAAGQATAATAVLGDRFVGERRAFVVGIQVAFGAAVGIVAAVAAGALAERAGWRAPFSLYGLSLAIAVLAAFVVERRPVARAEIRTRAGSLLPVLPVFLATVISMMVSFISTNQVPLQLSERGGGNPTLLSAVLGATTFATMFGALLYGKLRIRFGAAWTAAVGGVFQGISILSLGVTQSVHSIALGSILLGFGGGLLYPGFSHAILDRAPQGLRGRAIGLLFAAQFTGPFLSTALVVPTIVAFGRHDTLLTVGCLLIIGWTAQAIWRRPNSALKNPA